MFSTLRETAAAAALVWICAQSAVGAPGELLFRLNVPNPQPGAGFGGTVTTVDGNILVGEQLRLDSPTDSPGRAYLFDGRTGTLLHTLKNPEPGDLDYFAEAISGGDGKIFVSTSGPIERIYEFAAQSGQLLRRIDDPDGGGNNFGSSLTYHQGELLVSAPAYNGRIETLSIGRAYKLNSATNGTLTVPNPEPSRQEVFGVGESLAIFSDKFAIGCMADNAFAGRVWVFDRQSGNVVFTLENPNPQSKIFDWFGWSVAANDKSIVIGAREDGTNGVDGSGTVYLFDSQTGALQHTLFSPQPETNGEFGRSVALTPAGDILIGAWGTSVNGIEGAGHAYLFSGETGQLLMDFANPDPQPFAQFGWSVSAFEGGIAIGAQVGDADGAPQAGAVYVFSAVPEPSSLCLAGMASAFTIAMRFYRQRGLEQNASNSEISGEPCRHPPGTKSTQPGPRPTRSHETVTFVSKVAAFWPQKSPCSPELLTRQQVTTPDLACRQNSADSSRLGYASTNESYGHSPQDTDQSDQSMTMYRL